MPSSPRFRHARNKNTDVSASFTTGNCQLKVQNFAKKLHFMIVSVVYRRRGVLLFAPLLYISGILLYMGALGFDASRTSGGGTGLPPIRSVYWSPQVFGQIF
ncbi:hypothetical protein MTR67_018526 [Solanum verrucosum]|uniref:Uncharacterized protein n=1 Tax=Solanum verrucosum TaxID=315347 RepID=A0AAF0QKU5_SOLVR|nr:hypothetical protein MTR67_018526 [Solanum verrucosum]